MGKPDARQRRERGFARRLAAQHAGPEDEILARRQRALQGVGVAEIMRLLAERSLRVAALEREAARLQRQEAEKRAQQARLAGAVGTGDDERGAGLDREGKRREQAPAAPLQTEIPRAKPHSLRPSARAHFLAAPGLSAGQLRR